MRAGFISVWRDDVSLFLQPLQQNPAATSY